jgi:DNA-binding XRE family transcriptional regulator
MAPNYLPVKRILYIIMYRCPQCGMMEKKRKECYQLKKEEFSRIRRYLEKTQSQLAQLLGVSPKAIQSFEQGWRNIPVHTERQVLLLVALKNGAVAQKNGPCWAIRKCPVEIKENCPAWEFEAGHLCWFISGTICQGKVRESWQKKMKLCRQCNVFRAMLPPFK